MWHMKDDMTNPCGESESHTLGQVCVDQLVNCSMFIYPLRAFVSLMVVTR